MEPWVLEELVGVAGFCIFFQIVCSGPLPFGQNLPQPSLHEADPPHGLHPCIAAGVHQHHHGPLCGHALLQLAAHRGQQVQVRGWSGWWAGPARGHSRRQAPCMHGAHAVGTRSAMAGPDTQLPSHLPTAAAASARRSARRLSQRTQRPQRRPCLATSIEQPLAAGGQLAAGHPDSR